MKNKNTSHKCLNCGKAFTPNHNGADDTYGPECIKKFILKEIEDLETLNIKVDSSDFFTNKTFFDAKKEITEFMEQSEAQFEDVSIEYPLKDKLDEEIAEHFSQLDSMIREDLSTEAFHVNQLLQELETNTCSVKDLVKVMQKFQYPTASRLAGAIFVSKYADKISHKLLPLFNEEIKLMFAKTHKTGKNILEVLVNDKDAKVASYARMTLAIKKEMKKGA